MEMSRPAPAPVAAPSILQQIKDIQAVKELLNDSAESAGGNDTMNMIVNAGLKMLPAILAQHGGNYQQAGAAVRDNPLISGMIEKDPELLGEFCAAVRDKYGAQAARDLAAGYGYDFGEETPAQAPQIETTTEQQAGAMTFLVGTTEYAVPLEGLVDAEAEREKAMAEIKRLEGFLLGIEKKLGNERFVSSAPAAVVELERKKKADAETKIAALRQQWGI
jgi:hypothetical protein